MTHPTSAFWNLQGERNRYDGLVWSVQTNPSPNDIGYRDAVSRIFESFEKTTERGLAPGQKRRVGLKVYTNSGVGLSTPEELVAAVIDELEERGYKRSDIFIFDVSELRLREAHFLPSLGRRSEPNEFRDVPVYSFKNNDFINPDWFYESPLPENSGMSPLAAEIVSRYKTEENLNSRRSYLPEPFLHNVDFWINLPMLTDMEVTGISGALLNVSLWNVTNRDRFFASPANASVAAAEIAAIPELQRGWVLTILPLYQYQYIGGPSFNANYLGKQNRILASIDPVALDAMALKFINTERKKAGFRELSTNLGIITFAESLGLGRSSGVIIEEL